MEHIRHSDINCYELDSRSSSFLIVIDVILAMAGWTAYDLLGTVTSRMLFDSRKDKEKEEMNVSESLTALLTDYPTFLISSARQVLNM